jgi:hypothetical protein
MFPRMDEGPSAGQGLANAMAAQVVRQIRPASVAPLAAIDVDGYHELRHRGGPDVLRLKSPR